MFSFLASLFSAINRALGLWQGKKSEDRGRQATLKEANDELNRQVELSEHVTIVVDPERDERLRNRFDRSRKK